MVSFIKIRARAADRPIDSLLTTRNGHAFSMHLTSVWSGLSKTLTEMSSRKQKKIFLTDFFFGFLVFHLPNLEKIVLSYTFQLFTLKKWGNLGLVAEDEIVKRAAVVIKMRNNSYSWPRPLPRVLTWPWNNKRSEVKGLQQYLKFPSLCDNLKCQVYVFQGKSLSTKYVFNSDTALENCSSS